MLIVWIIFLITGILFIAMPELVGYIIWAIFLTISINIFVLSHRINNLKKHHNNDKDTKVFSFGWYEFIKKNK